MNPIGGCEETWNPVVGCSKCSDGCKNCYAEKFAVRHCGNPKTRVKYAGTIINKRWTGICRLNEKEIYKPFHWKKPRVIFVCSMGDLFHESVPFKWVDRIMDTVDANRRHKFLFLTKRAERMEIYFKQRYTTYLIHNRTLLPGEIGFDIPLPNLAIGVTAENQEMADLRIPTLLQIPAAVRFVSIEPMLGTVNLEKIKIPEKDCVLKDHRYIDYYFNSLTVHDENNYHQPPTKIDWVIAGGETGPGARTFTGMAEAIINLIDQCVSASVPFFYKGPDSVGVYFDEPGAYMYRYKNEPKKQYEIGGKEYRKRPAGW